jgi:outer membrane protein TolC
MRNKFLTTLLVSILLFSAEISAQEGWTLRLAIDTAIQKNLGIQIARNESVIAANSSSAGAAGMLPTVTVGGSASRALNEIQQEFRTGDVLSTGDVDATNTQAVAELNWTIFDGFRMFATRERLKVLESIGELNVKQQLIEVIGRTARSYFDLQRYQLLVEFTSNGLALYQERVRLAQKKLELGNAPRTELLQATVDYNEQLSVLTVRKAAMENARVVLNGHLLRPVMDSITVVDSITVNDAPSYDYFLSRLELGNTSIQEMLLMQQVAEKQVIEAQSNYYPVLDVNAGYNYVRNTTSQGFFLENRSMGPQAGLSINWNIFDGNTIRKNVQNSKIISQNSRLQLEQARVDMNVALRIAWLNYSAALEVYNREGESNTLATQNLDITGERFRLGESDVLELREAQRTKEDAQSRLANAYYEVRIALVQLMQLTGEIY